MPYKEKETEKLYYSISEVAEMFDVNTSLIRFWEKEFNILKPKKNKKGNRLFTKEDIQNLRTIYHLVKEKGFTLQGAREKLKEKQQPQISQEELLKKLQEIKATLLDLNDRIVEEPAQKPLTLAQKLSEAKSETKSKEKEREKEPLVSPNQISLF